LQTEIAFVVLLGIMIYYQLVRSDPRVIGALVIITLWGAFAMYYLFGGKATSVISKEKKGQSFIQAEVADRKGESVPSTNYYLEKFTDKSSIHLGKNKSLLRMTDELAFVRMFDRPRYQDLIMHLDRYQKVYIYILAGRYDSKSYISVFQDLIDGSLEILYSLYFIVPMQMRHVYGVDSFATIEKNIERFTALSRRMLTVLESFAKKEGGYMHIQPSAPRGSSSSDRQHILP